jgi:integrase/recombinase XerD
MTTNLFQSPLATKMQTFLDMRRALGRKAVADQKILRYIDRFLVSVLEPGEPITREIIHQWLKNIEPLSLGTRINRVSTFRQFCRYLSHFDRRTYLIHGGFLPKRTRPVPYIYTDQQIRTIMAAAQQTGPKGSLHPVAISTLIGLLYSTGLRISEALKLTLEDVDLKQRLLLIRQTKFKKSRWIPISTSTTRSLEFFLAQRQRHGFSTDKTSSVFVNSRKNANGRPYGYGGFRLTFIEIIRKEKIRGPVGESGPRVHDLRHSFAVHRLAKWYQEGAVISAKLPLLSTYLGHSSLIGTEIYLQATAQLLKEANKRFHKYCALTDSRQISKGGVHVQ